MHFSRQEFCSLSSYNIKGGHWKIQVTRARGNLRSSSFTNPADSEFSILQIKYLSKYSNDKSIKPISRQVSPGGFSSFPYFIHLRCCSCLWSFHFTAMPSSLFFYSKYAFCFHVVYKLIALIVCNKNTVTTIKAWFVENHE